MIAMIFEFSMDLDDNAVLEEYHAEASELRELLPDVDGFEGVERFESVSDPGKFVALGFFRDEEAVARWRNIPQHRRAQALGRNRLFTHYRLRMAEVTRDYDRHRRTQAPDDSTRFHHG